MILAFLSFFVVYEMCFLVGLFFAVVSGIASGIFGSHHDIGHGADVSHDVDAGHPGDAGHVAAVGSHMPEFSPLSPVTLFSFITCFGGGGMIFSRIELTSAPYLHLPLAFVSGFAGALVVFLLFHKIFSVTQSSSEARVAGLVGHSATVVTPIPEHGLGEIAYVVGGTRYNAPAREESGQTVTVGAEVKITRAVGGNFYVKQI